MATELIEEGNAGDEHMPAEFNMAIAEAVDLHPDDIATASGIARERVFALESLEQIKRILVDRAIVSAIHDRRHHLNRMTAQQAMAPKRTDDTPQEQRSSPSSNLDGRPRPRDCSAANAACARAMLGYMLCGKSIGTSTRNDLLKAKEKLKGDAIGMMRDAIFCDELLKALKPRKTVAQSIKEADAVRLFKLASERAQAAVIAETREAQSRKRSA